MFNTTKNNELFNAIIDEINNTFCENNDELILIDVSTTMFRNDDDNNDDELTYCDMLISTM